MKKGIEKCICIRRATAMKGRPEIDCTVADLSKV
jgi:hypothetical protein